MSTAIDRRAVLSRVAAEAEVLAEQLRFYENCVVNAPSDRSYDYAVYMTDPCADADEFDRQYAQYVAGVEAGLANTEARIERFVAEHRGELLELAAVVAQAEAEADADPDEEFPRVDRGVLVRESSR